MNKYNVSCLGMPFQQKPFPAERLCSDMVLSIPRLIPRKDPYQKSTFIRTYKHTCIHKALPHTDAYTAGQVYI